MHRLQTPTAANEFIGQPIEQVWIARSFTQATEVPWRWHNPAPKVMHPKSVDERSRNQRMLTIGEMLCISQPAASGWDLRVVVWQRIGWQYAQFTWRNFIARLLNIATRKAIGDWLVSWNLS